MCCTVPGCTGSFTVFTQPKLLVLDEVGYLTLDPTEASLLFQLIARRYERHQPLVLTSNKPFGERGRVFGGDVVLASAALGRLLHRATVLQIRGDSYRLRERRQAGLPPATPPPPPPNRDVTHRGGRHAPAPPASRPRREAARLPRPPG